MSRPLFLVLTYNQERYISEAVKAALAQEGVELDILISDDCSPDGTFEVIEASVEDYCGLHHVRTNRNPENLGLIGHLNFLLEGVDNEHIILAAGDDISVPGRARATMDAFEANACDLVHSSVEEIGVDGERQTTTPTRALFHRTTDLTRSAVGLGLYIGATGAIHRRLFDRYGPLPEGTYEDLVFGFRAVLERGAHYIAEPLVRYRAGIGISAEIATTNAEKWRAERRKTLLRHKRVMDARLADAATAGLPANHAVIGQIQRKRASFDTRLRVSGQGAAFAIRETLTGDRRALSAWWSESKREQRALNSGS